MLIADRHLDFCQQLLSRFRNQGIRADIDDRNGTLGKKVLQGEKEWIPFIIVVGDKEIDTGVLSVRNTVTDKIDHMNDDRLILTVKEEMAGKPFAPPATPGLLSTCPSFYC